eukprot:5577875-Pleurochrysis_carterae.AAC.3
MQGRLASALCRASHPCLLPLPSPRLSEYRVRTCRHLHTHTAFCTGAKRARFLLRTLSQRGRCFRSDCMFKHAEDAAIEVRRADCGGRGADCGGQRAHCAARRCGCGFAGGARGGAACLPELWRRRLRGALALVAAAG